MTLIGFFGAVLLVLTIIACFELMLTGKVTIFAVFFTFLFRVVGELLRGVLELIRLLLLGLLRGLAALLGVTLRNTWRP